MLGALPTARERHLAGSVPGMTTMVVAEGMNRRAPAALKGLGDAPASRNLVAPNNPRGTEAKTQGERRVLASRRPMTLLRPSGEFLTRPAERRPVGPSSHEPLRSTR
jgi:hypothetical protein